jgi:hypothetical protein
MDTWRKAVSPPVMPPQMARLSRASLLGATLTWCHIGGRAHTSLLSCVSAYGVAPTRQRDSKGPDLKKKLLVGFVSQILIKKIKMEKNLVAPDNIVYSRARIRIEKGKMVHPSANFN